jgi:hypothetical protein
MVNPFLVILVEFAVDLAFPIDAPEIAGKLT